MKTKTIIIIIFTFLILISILFLIMPRPINQQGYKTEILAKNLDTPWAIDFLPDNKMIFTERGGRVSILDNGTTKNIGNINVTEIGESGLLGITVDPEFNENKFIYLYYTSQNGNRISRFTLNEKLENETILIDNIPSAQLHNGGRIKFGPDGKLYATTGDATNHLSAQNINSTAGKILRLNKDGTVPSDNPFGNYVYSYGHRDPQGLAWSPFNGQLYSSEHGEIQNDEINLIVKGGNYGWPYYQCTSPPGYIAPIRCYDNFTLAPSGIAFYGNDLYIAGLRGNQLRRVTFDTNGNIINEVALFTDLGRIREVVEYNGYLYIATSNRDGRGIPKVNDDKIIRIKP